MRGGEAGVTEKDYADRSNGLLRTSARNDGRERGRGNKIQIAITKGKGTEAFIF